MSVAQKVKWFFQTLGGYAVDLVEWIERTFADPQIAAQVRADLGLDTTNPATPAPLDPSVKQKIDELRAKPDVDEAALIELLYQIAGVVDTVQTFAEAVKTEGVSGSDVFWLLAKVWAVDSLRLRSTAGYALAGLIGLILEDEETLAVIDPAPLTRLLRREATEDDSEALVDRLSFYAGAIVVVVDAYAEEIGKDVEAFAGWDPEPGSDIEAALVARRALTIAFKSDADVDGIVPMITLIGVPKAHGGPGIFVSVGAKLTVEHDTGDHMYKVEFGANGAFATFISFDGEVRTLGGGTPSFNLTMVPKQKDGKDLPVSVIGAAKGDRLEIGGFGYGVEVGAEHAGFKAHLRQGKLVINVGGDGFLSNLPARTFEAEFDLGLIADTKNGVRFDGGTGLTVQLPVAYTVGERHGFTVQYLAFELKLAPEYGAEFRGAFSLHLGPFQATVDSIGLKLPMSKWADATKPGDAVEFLAPKGIGLTMSNKSGTVKGGGYLYFDPAQHEYSGALELKFSKWGLKALGLITTQRPDGSDGWSMLLLMYASLRVPISANLYWTGIGGIIGLHHRVELEALTSGMASGVLDDVLFPQNPVADAPRILARYRQLFPIEKDTLLFAVMAEFEYMKPATVTARLGFLFEVRNALGDGDAKLTKVVLIGQLLAQTPPKATGAPAIVKLLVDVVGFYDVEKQFLMIRARLRDSYIGISERVKLNLSGELLVAWSFDDDHPAMVLTVGGFHPSFTEIPAGVPRTLERLAVSCAIGPIKLRHEMYIAITSNSMQTGVKSEIKADFGVASIQGNLAFDALFYFYPVFRFEVDVAFAVSVRAFGTNLIAVSVNAMLTGPGAWRVKGSFSISFLWWDKTIPFDESWGDAPKVEVPTRSGVEELRRELADPAKLLPSPPVGGQGLVVLADPGPLAPIVAHPLGRISVWQRALPLEVRVDRMDGSMLSEGPSTFAITETRVGGVTVPVDPVLEHFARGQYMELSEKEKIEGHAFERFTCGVSVGSEQYVVPTAGTTVACDYETKYMEPQPRLNMHWLTVAAQRTTLSAEFAFELAPLGAAGRSARARADLLTTPDTGPAKVRPAPLTVVDASTLADLDGAELTSAARAGALAVARGGRVVETFEVMA